MSSLNNSIVSFTPLGGRSFQQIETVPFAPLGSAQTQVQGLDSRAVVAASNALQRGAMSEGARRDDQKKIDAIAGDIVKATNMTVVKVSKSLDEFHEQTSQIQMGVIQYFKSVLDRAKEKDSTLTPKDVEMVSSFAGAAATMNATCFENTKNGLLLIEKGAGVIVETARNAIKEIINIQMQRIAVYQSALEVLQKAEIHAVDIEMKRFDMRLKEQAQLFEFGIQLYQLQNTDRANQRQNTTELAKAELENQKHLWATQLSAYELTTKKELEEFKTQAESRIQERKIEEEAKVAQAKAENEKIGAIGGTIGSVAGAVIPAAASSCVLQ